MAKARLALPTCGFLGVEGELFGTRLRVVEPDAEYVEALDRSWPRARAASAEHKEWRWAHIRERSRDILALEHVDGRCIGIWTSGRSVFRLGGTPCYRLDRVEVSPFFVGQGWGPVVVAACCARALELGASTIVLGALPQAAPFWNRLAAVGAPPGWTCEPPLLAYTVTPDVVENLGGVFHAQFGPR